MGLAPEFWVTRGKVTQMTRAWCMQKYACQVLGSLGVWKVRISHIQLCLPLSPVHSQENRTRPAPHTATREPLKEPARDNGLVLQETQRNKKKTLCPPSFPSPTQVTVATVSLLVPKASISGGQVASGLGPGLDWLPGRVVGAAARGQWATAGWLHPAPGR